MSVCSATDIHSKLASSLQHNDILPHTEAISYLCLHNHKSAIQTLNLGGKIRIRILIMVLPVGVFLVVVGSRRQTISLL